MYICTETSLKPDTFTCWQKKRLRPISKEYFWFYLHKLMFTTTKKQHIFSVVWLEQIAMKTNSWPPHNMNNNNF